MLAMTKPKCPFCDSTDAELFSLYGQTLFGSQYYCNNCRSIFEVVRFHEQEQAEEEQEEGNQHEV